MDLKYSVITPVTAFTEDPVLQLLYNKCVANPSQITARITVRLDLSLLSWLGIYPRKVVELKADCGVSGAGALRTLDGLGRVASNVTTLFQTPNLPGIL